MRTTTYPTVTIRFSAATFSASELSFLKREGDGGIWAYVPDVDFGLYWHSRYKAQYGIDKSMFDKWSRVHNAAVAAAGNPETYILKHVF
jgi:hypothetical protein